MIRFFLLLLLPLILHPVPYTDQRRPSDPFVSGDGFRAYADFVFDEEDSSLNPLSVKEKSTVFVKLDLLGRFFQEIHPFITHPYILISHNADDPGPGPYWNFLDDPKIIAWFTQNMDGQSHPKLHPIPIGIANRYWGHGNTDMLQKEIDKKAEKPHLVYLNITIQNYYPERWEVFQLMRQASFCYRTIKKRFDRYLQDVAASKFVLSPRGNGLDTHRLWESLYLKSYPIVKTSTLDPLYEGLPVIVIQNWREVTEEFLNQKYEEMNQKSWNFEKLQMDYWKRLIDSYK